MQAGRLKHRVYFDEPVTSQSTSGEEIVTWTESMHLFASVEPMRGRERLVAGQINADIDTRIRIRWSTDADRINAKWRARLGSVVYNIKSVAHIELAQREIEIMAASGLNSG